MKYRIKRRPGFCSEVPSRPRCIGVFRAPPRLTTRPPRCCVRVVSLGGSLAVRQRGRDGHTATNGAAERQRSRKNQAQESRSKSTATTTARGGHGRIPEADRGG